MMRVTTWRELIPWPPHEDQVAVGGRVWCNPLRDLLKLAPGVDHQHTWAATSKEYPDGMTHIEAESEEALAEAVRRVYRYHDITREIAELIRRAK
jgi:hypothetical protein